MGAPENLLTWPAILTVSGAAFATFLIVQYTKGLLDRVWHIPTDIYATVIAAGLLIAATAAVGDPLTWGMVLLCVINGFVVALAAGNVANKVQNPPGAKPPGEGM